MPLEGRSCPGDLPFGVEVERTSQPRRRTCAELPDDAEGHCQSENTGGQKRRHVGSSFGLFSVIPCQPRDGVDPWVISATTARIRQPAATNSAPWAYIAARNSLPAASRKVTPVRSKRRTGLCRPARVLCQQRSNSRTQGPANLPSSWNVRE